MTIARFYKMTARPEAADALADALAALADAVRPLPGCQGVELMRDTTEPTSFVFIERWASIDAHKSAGSQLAKDVMAPVMDALAGRPEGSYLDVLKIA